MKKVELLAPAGDLEKLKYAVMYGADAVFIGAKRFSLRSRASNFTYQDIKEGCEFAHKHNAKIHVTCNILPHESDMEGLLEHLKKLEECGVDAIICASIHILKMVKENTKMEAHVSTQETTTNIEAVRFWESMGADRVVLGRELSIEQIKEIKKSAKADIEVFIHGGMCVSYSGRCMLSNNMTNRDANRGGCAHSCRWYYDLICNNHKINDDEYFQISSKDLCAIKDIKDLILSGADSFKIEGRMKSLHYISTVVKTYRMIIDDILCGNENIDINYYENEIRKAENRETSHGFLHGDVTISEQLYNKRSEDVSQAFCGIVKFYDSKTNMAYIESRNFFKPHSYIELFGPKLQKVIKIEEIYDKDGNSLDASRHPGDIIHFKCDTKLNEYDMIRIYED